MAKDTSKDIERRLEEVEKIARAPKDMEGGETTRRLAALEKAIEVKNDKHLKTIAIIFSCLAGLIAVCAIMVTALGWLSRSESREATKDMKSEVREEMNKIEKRFQALAGEAFKKPVLQAVTADGSPLEGKTNAAYYGGMMQIYTVFLKNIGDRRTEPLSVKFSLGTDVNALNHEDWDQAPALGKDFATSFYSKRTTTTIAPGQTLNVHPLVITGAPPNVTPCELEVFYGGEQVLRTSFFIKGP